MLLPAEPPMTERTQIIQVATASYQIIAITWTHEAMKPPEAAPNNKKALEPHRRRNVRELGLQLRHSISKDMDRTHGRANGCMLTK